MKKYKNRIIDLTHTIENGMPIFPDSPGPEIINHDLYDEYGVYVQDLKIGGHLDTPTHIFKGRGNTETYDISNFFGPGIVINCSNYVVDEKIGVEILEKSGNLEDCDFNFNLYRLV